MENSIESLINKECVGLEEDFHFEQNLVELAPKQVRNLITMS